MNSFSTKHPVIFCIILTIVAFIAAGVLTALVTAMGFSTELGTVIGRIIIAVVLAAFFFRCFHWDKSFSGIALAWPVLIVVVWNIAYHLMSGAEFVTASAIPGSILAGLAPGLFEEVIFRMGLFNFCRWIGRKIRGPQPSTSQLKHPNIFPWVAALISGAVFAAVHVHAATFAPLWFLGVAFAWLYWASGTIRSSMLCHFLFNLINLSLCLLVGS